MRKLLGFGGGALSIARTHVGELQRSKLAEVKALATPERRADLERQIDTLRDLTRPAASPSQNDVTMEMLSRLLLGVLVELDQPKHQQTIAKGPRSPKTPRVGKAPSCWAFDLRRDVRVDLRPWVREYVVGGGKTASVQVLVRGHHKRQVHGIGRKDRKWIHIEPYWRGPEDAPIAVRGHRVKGS